MSEHELEVPEADAAEQAAFVTAGDTEAGDSDSAGEIPDEVDPADLADQRHDVPLDDDDYR